MCLLLSAIALWLSDFTNFTDILSEYRSKESLLDKVQSCPMILANGASSSPMLI